VTSAAPSESALPIFVDPEFQEGSYSAHVEVPAPPMHELSGSHPTFGLSSGLTPPTRRRRRELPVTDKVIVAPQPAEPSTPSSSTSSSRLSANRSCDGPARRVTRRIGTPGAPKAGRRRPRACIEEEQAEDDSAALLASFSSLRLEPPAKRVCLPSVGSDCKMPEPEELAKDTAASPADILPPMAATLQTPPRRHKVQGRLNFDNGDISAGLRSPARIHSCSLSRASPQDRGPESASSPSAQGPDALPWELDPGYLTHGCKPAGQTSIPSDGLSGLSALGSLFSRTAGVRDGSCPRLLIFED